jgi:hypothetical protein
MKTRNIIIIGLWSLSLLFLAISYNLECQMMNYEMQDNYNSFGYWLIYNLWELWLITGALLFVAILGTVVWVTLWSVDRKLERLRIVCPYCKR